MKKGDARRIAQAQGLKRYSDGRMCKNGHIAERLTSCGRCVECHRATKRFRGRIVTLGKKMRIAKFGFDPLDLRYRRKERGIGLSEKKQLVALRDKRKLLGRKDRPSIESQPES